MNVIIEIYFNRGFLFSYKCYYINLFYFYDFIEIFGILLIVVLFNKV